jgi:uncharacterized OsmC-like protein
VKITLLSDERLRIEDAAGPLTVEAESAEQAYSPFHMMASGLGLCTFSVLASWATHAKLDLTGLAIEVQWSFVDNPHRVGNYAVEIRWPGLPEARRAPAIRVAELCGVHNTFTHPPEIWIEVSA